MTSHDGERESEGNGESSSSVSSPREFAPIIRTESEQDSGAATRPPVSPSPQSRSRHGYGTIRASHSESRLESLPVDSSGFRSGTASLRPPRSPVIGPQNFDKTPKKPPMRRVTSKPYRGQEFSVDDDVSEYEEDNAVRQSSGRSTGRPTASLRRRGQAIPALQRVDSVESSPNTVPFDSISGRYTDDAQSARHMRLGDDNNNDVIGHDAHDEDDVDDDEDDDDDVSDAESFTLKDRQQAINETHPFGIRIWKPALYKKLRSVEKTAEGDIHSAPGEHVSPLLFLAGLFWSLLFGWWLALAAFLAAVICFVFGYLPDATAYGKVFWGLSGYLLYPFGSFVRLETDANYADEDEGEGRSISEYEQWQSGDIEHGRLFFGPVASRSLVGRRRNSVDSASERESLLGRTGRRHSDDDVSSRAKRRFFGRGEWTFGRVIFYTLFYLLVGPLMLFVSLLCWMLVFWIPMGRVTMILFRHLRRHPLALSFQADSTYSRVPSRPSSSILLCTYRAAGLKYWKYTIDGTNIFLINLLGIVVFVIFDYFVLYNGLQVESWITHPGLLFVLALFSIIPLAYFIGQAVASISAQSSMGLGAAINAFFSTVVEVYLYCVALTEGKAQLVEGSIIGSLFAGILFLPGLSMCFGAISRKTQRFNVKSAGVTSTMLLFAAIAAFGPTLFYQIYGSHELNCHNCSIPDLSGGRDCRRCYFSQVPAVKNKFFQKAVQPYTWFAGVLLFLSYIIGLWFTLRTHAAIIWSSDLDEKKPAPHQLTQHHRGSTVSLHATHKHPANHGQTAPTPKGSVRESQLYARILGQSLKQVGLSPRDEEPSNEQQAASGPDHDGSTTPHLVPPKPKDHNTTNLSLPGLSDEENERLVRQVAEVAATAATVAARDATKHPKKSGGGNHGGTPGTKTPTGAGNSGLDGTNDVGIITDHHASAHGHGGDGGGHDAPNWGRTKSFVILLVATLLYAIIAEILVNTVDVVLESIDIDEKFLGITLFSLVPNTTEFLNAISFAMNGNIALSMEIGSAYALQVCLLQIPAVLAFSAFFTRAMDPSDLSDHSFNLIFPQWDMITVILCVFLFSYVYGEGKSNYFKGSILLLTYLFVVVGFFLSGFNTIDAMGVDPSDTLALGVLKNPDGSFRVADIKQ